MLNLFQHPICYVYSMLSIQHRVDRSVGSPIRWPADGVTWMINAS
jgi:hypothetical protein